MTLIQYGWANITRYYTKLLTTIADVVIQKKSAIKITVDFRNPRTLTSGDFRNPRTLTSGDYRNPRTKTSVDFEDITVIT